MPKLHVGWRFDGEGDYFLRVCELLLVECDTLLLICYGDAIVFDSNIIAYGDGEWLFQVPIDKIGRCDGGLFSLELLGCIDKIGYRGDNRDD